MLCIAQIGPFPVLLGAVIWVFWSGDTPGASVLAIWSLVVGTLDNFYARCSSAWAPTCRCC